MVRQKRNNRFQSIAVFLIIPLVSGIVIEKQIRINQLWQTVDTARGKKDSNARIQALEKLVQAGESLANKDFSSADLRGANLNRADLRGADLRGADLSSANLSSANLNRANLNRANLSLANLSSANLSLADLSSADLIGADLSSADFSSPDLMYFKNFTLEQVKSANNWDKAIYDKDFRAKLGLPPEPAK